MIRITRKFSKHPVAANLLMILMIVSGLFALKQLKTEYVPHFDANFIDVTITWPGASAQDVETAITTPLEQAFSNLDFLQEITSYATTSVGSVSVEFKEHTDMSFALQKVNEYIAQTTLPQDTEPPQIERTFKYDSIAKVILSSPDNIEALKNYAYQFKRELISRGINRVNVIGTPEQEIAIEIDSTTLQRLGLSLPQLGKKIQERSQDIPTGVVGKGDIGMELRSLNKRRTENSFYNLPLLHDNTGQDLRLSDIATIEARPKAGNAEIYYKGQPAILFDIWHLSSGNSLEHAKILKEWVEEVKPTLPPSFTVEIFDQRWKLLNERIMVLVKNGLGGLILVIGILFLFLNRQAAIWVSAGIPTSLLAAMAVLYFTGGSINLISLFAFIMALGIIVDDAIVVGEDAITHYRMGETSLKSVQGAVNRMFIPVVTSSLTTIAAFLPLMLISGPFGQILIAIPIVVICVILASLVECFFVLPGHLHHSLKNLPKKTSENSVHWLTKKLNHFKEQHFKPLLKTILQKRLITCGAVILLFFFSIFLVVFGRIGFNFFPTPEGTTILASVKFSAGAKSSEVSEFADKMENTLWQLSDQFTEANNEEAPVVKLAVKRLNMASFTSGDNFVSGEQYAMVEAELLAPDKRDTRNIDLINAWEGSLSKHPGIEKLSVSIPNDTIKGKDLDVFLTGADSGKLKEAAMFLNSVLSEKEGVFNIQDDLPYGRDQLIFNLTPTAEALDFTVEDIGRQLRAALDGYLIQAFYSKDEEIEVRLMLNEKERDRLQLLRYLPIIHPKTKEATTLDNLITLRVEKAVDMLRHTDSVLGVHVTAEVNAELNNTNKILAELEKDALPIIEQRYGVKHSLKGRRTDQIAIIDDMATGAVLSLTLIYIILAWVFSSYLWPIAVMSVIPLGLTGAILGHFVMGMDLTILSLFGFFGLSGVVINDSIILITFYKQLREEGKERNEALIEASAARLRPVFLTSVTTIAGLLPLLFESSLQAQFLIPMAISITFGLAFSTILVLIVIPVLLSAVESVRSRWLRFHGFQPGN